MEVVANNYLPGDQRLVDKIVYELKAQGIFDQFRKECFADVDTKPAYQNLRQRVEGSVTGFLKEQSWRPDMNKNQVREMLRKTITELGFLETGVERIVDQVVNPKINTVFLPKVEEVVYNYLGIKKPNRNENSRNEQCDLLPNDLEAVSPESEPADKRDEKSTDNLQDMDENKTEEEESPPFEPLDEQSVYVPHEENSVDSHLSGFSGLISHESNQSHENKVTQMELDSQVSRNSSDSRLSIVTSDENSKMDIGEDSQSKSIKSNDSNQKSDNNDKGDKNRYKSSERHKSRSESRSDRDKKSSKDSKSRHSSSSKDKDRSHDRKDSKSSSGKNDKVKDDKVKEDKVKDDKVKEDKAKDDKIKDDKAKDKDTKDKSDKEKDRHKSSSSSSSKHSNNNNSSSSNSKDKIIKKESSSSSDKHKSDKDKGRSSSSSSNHKDSKTKDKSSDSKSKDKSSSSEKHKHSSSSSSSSHNDRHKKDKKKDNKSKDDHYSSKDKKNDRRSTDRDSNDGQSSKQNLPSTSSESSHSSQTQKSTQESNRGGGGDSGNSDHSETTTKAPVVITSSIENSEVTITSPETQRLRVLKPKCASNIQEALRLMKIRKQLAKLEKQNQLSLTTVNVNSSLLLSSSIDLDNLRQDSSENEKFKQESMNNKIIAELEVVPSPLQNTVISQDNWDAMEAKLREEVCSEFKEYNEEESLDDSMEEKPQSPEEKVKKIEEKEVLQAEEEEDCKYFEPVDLKKIEFLQVVGSFIKRVEMCKKKPRGPFVKRKIEDTDVKNNNKKVKLAMENKKRNTRRNKEKTNSGTDITQTQNGKFSLPLSPAESDKSVGRKDETVLVPLRTKRNSLSKANSQRYSSDDLYKPRPTFLNSRRRGAKNLEN